MLRRNAKKRKLRDEAYTGKPELEGQSVGKERYAHEVQDGQVHEMDGTLDPIEIERSRERYEIEDTSAPVEAGFTSNILEMEGRHGTTEVGRTSVSSGEARL